MTPPSDEAVKAAFAICEYDLNNRDTWESFDVAEEFLMKSGLRRKHESPSEFAARILAAHARAKDSEVARLREALEESKDELTLTNDAIRHFAKKVPDFETSMPNQTRPTIRKALTGEASA